MKARLYIDIQFGKRATDAESMATALDNVLDTGMVQLSDCWDEYGGKPKVGKFFVLDTEQALGFAEGSSDRLVHGMGRRSRQVARPHPGLPPAGRREVAERDRLGCIRQRYRGAKTC